MAVYIQNFGSSSSGNSTLIRDEHTSLLVDFGFSQKYLNHHLSAHELSLEKISAALLTHLHGDHLNGPALKKLIEHNIPIVTASSIAAELQRRYPFCSAHHFILSEERPALLGDFLIRSFEVSHDVEGGCYGFTVEKGPQKITIATDLGFPQNGLASLFTDSDFIILESNYDPQLLDQSGRSPLLIERIKSIGHLSNQQSARFMRDILDQSSKLPRTVLLVHLSQQCNTESLAIGNMKHTLKSLGFPSISVHAAGARKAGPLFTLP